MKASAFAISMILILVPLAGCAGSDGEVNIDLTTEEIQELIDDNIDDFLNNTTVTVNQENHNNTTNSQTIVNHYNNTTIEQPSSLKSKSGAMPGLAYVDDAPMGPAVLVREDRFAAAAAGNSAAGLDSANICVGIGTTTEGNMQDWFASREIAFTSVPVADAAEATAKFIDGSCDAFTGDMSAMVAKKWQLDTDGSMNGVDIWIASELMSKEPLGAATRDMDSDFKDVVAWVWYGMVTAEEMGVTSSNHGAMATSACAVNDAGSATDPGMCRLLTENLGLGTATNPLAGTWMAAVLDAAGNYGEAYDDAFCAGDYDGTSGSAAMNDCLISRAGTLNALVSEGGIQYAPPMR